MHVIESPTLELTSKNIGEVWEGGGFQNPWNPPGYTPDLFFFIIRDHSNWYLLLWQPCLTFFFSFLVFIFCTYKYISSFSSFCINFVFMYLLSGEANKIYFNFLVLKVMKYIEDITRWLEDMKLSSSGKNISRVSAANKWNLFSMRR